MSRKWSLILVAALTVSLALTATVQAKSDSGATVTKVTVPSFFVDLEGTFFPATCHVTLVVNRNHRKETFQCSFDDAVPARYLCDTSNGCTWSSDIDGAPAISTHFVITPSGRMRGWALYW
jgi:hypothetical protein